LLHTSSFPHHALSASTIFVGDQCRFAADGHRAGIVARAQGIEGAHFLAGQFAVLRSGVLGEAARFLDQGGLAILKLAQVLTLMVAQQQ